LYNEALQATRTLINFQCESKSQERHATVIQATSDRIIPVKITVGIDQSGASANGMPFGSQL
jgi:hypothetical protein